MKLSRGVVGMCICVFSLVAGKIYAQEEVIVVPSGAPYSCSEGKRV